MLTRLRTKSRELALQALFYMDMRHDMSEEAINLYCECFSPPEKAIPFFLQLVNGVIAAKPEIDKRIEQFSQNWKLSRMSCVDRNVLRIAVYEMLYCPDIPSKVSINEAIDMGKLYGTEDSGAFINGILDGIRNSLKAENEQINAA